MRSLVGGLGGVLSLGGKQVCEVVIRTPWQLLRAGAAARTCTHTHTYNPHTST